MNRLTDEQQHAVSLSGTGEDLKVEAFAGAGKTTTLAAIAGQAKGRGLYLAFNAAIAREAKSKFPGHVDCRTAHSLAFRAVGNRYKERLDQRLTGRVIAEALNLPDLGEMSAVGFGNLVLTSVNRYTNSAKREFARESHAPWDALQVVENEMARNHLADQIVRAASRLWDRMIDENDSVPTTHDAYLKLWAMSEPRLGKDFILFDEAQDANGLMMMLVQNQDAQKVWVGDRYQQIYSWRGAENAMQQIDTPHTTQITQSFRFGQPIADVANAVLNHHLEADVHIRGFEPIKSRVTGLRRTDAILCRTNLQVVENVMDEVADGRRPFVVGGVGTTINLIYGAQDLKFGRKPTHPDLALFKDWDELKEFADSDAGADLAPLVRIMDKFKTKTLLDSLGKIKHVREQEADVVISTAHKSKGREWDSVRLEDDFRAPPREGDDEENHWQQEDSNLLYVAATRAQKVLNIADCKAAQDALKPREEKPEV